MDKTKVKDHKNLVRQGGSKAILNVDNDELKRYRIERDQKLAMAKVVKEHEQVKKDVSDIKDMLGMILQKLETKA